jgi:hypothetical protein
MNNVKSGRCDVGKEENLPRGQSVFIRSEVCVCKLVTIPDISKTKRYGRLAHCGTISLELGPAVCTDIVGPLGGIFALVNVLKVWIALAAGCCDWMPGDQARIAFNQTR